MSWILVPGTLVGEVPSLAIARGTLPSFRTVRRFRTQVVGRYNLELLPRGGHGNSTDQHTQNELLNPQRSTPFPLVPMASRHGR